ncbi:hypothetical protein BGC07_10320 [Piscirickettsia litoralis]|uniref:Uncharacterized protein n=2 Tax=Piscirickettsia litoralis TaxID=1891921 RepID=A0ABX3A723_9GAMM|nr:hypothetical protein BGC07_10320 [Piscirickettsia litoralis]
MALTLCEINKENWTPLHLLYFHFDKRLAQVLEGIPFTEQQRIWLSSVLCMAKNDKQIKENHELRKITKAFQKRDLDLSKYWPHLRDKPRPLDWITNELMNTSLDEAKAKTSNSLKKRMADDLKREIRYGSKSMVFTFLTAVRVMSHHKFRFRSTTTKKTNAYIAMEPYVRVLKELLGVSDSDLCAAMKNKGHLANGCYMTYSQFRQKTNDKSKQLLVTQTMEG